MYIKMHNFFMKRAIIIANNIITNKYPKIAYIIVKNNTIIYEGFYKNYYYNIINIIQYIQKKINVTKYNIYFTLEPYIDYKNILYIKNILQNTINTIIIGIKNPYLNFKGLMILKKYGINIIENILKNECYMLNHKFFIFYKKKRPFILLTWSQTLDGFMLFKNNIYIKQLNHKWRTEIDSILVNTQTIINNNSFLNTKYWYGKNPIRIILDKNLIIPNYYNIYNNQQKTLIITEQKKISNKKNIYFLNIKFNTNFLLKLINKLYLLKIKSIIIEGEKKIIEYLIKNYFWDEARIIIYHDLLKFTPKIKAPIIFNKNFSQTNFVNNTLLIKQNI